LSKRFLLVEYFGWLSASNYTLRTVQNYCLALIHFVVFLMQCDDSRVAFTLRSSDLPETKEWLQTQKKWVTPLAMKQSRARNSFESLQDRNKWLDFKDVLIMREKLITIFYDHIYKYTFIECLSLREAYNIRNIVMVLLFTLGMPLRSQNLILTITDRKQLAIEAKENCYVIGADSSGLGFRDLDRSYRSDQIFFFSPPRFTLFQI
jgi:hypothetical protein